MATIEKLNSIAASKAAIKVAIQEKGVSCDDTLAEYANRIKAIPTGSTVKVEESHTATITTNGSHTITPSEGYDAMMQAVVDVNIATRTRQFNGTVDTEGLKVLGWTDEDILDLQANVWWYDWENNRYKVSDYDKNFSGTSYENDTTAVFAKKGYLNFKGSNIVAVPRLTGTGTLDVRYCKKLIYIGGVDNTLDFPAESQFDNCKHLLSIPVLDTSRVTSAKYMFAYCFNLETIPVLDTSQVTDMHWMFTSCSRLQTIPTLDTSKVTNMREMFQYCSNLESIPVLDTSKVTDMTDMFANCSNLELVPALDLSSVASTCEMFMYCSKLQTVPALDTSKATDMRDMFKYCDELQSIEGIDFSSATNLGNVIGSNWYHLPKLTNLVVNGSINESLSCDSSDQLSYDSIKSVLSAASRTTKPSDAKTLTFRITVSDKEGELATLVSDCTTKGWTITGLTIN